MKYALRFTDVLQLGWNEDYYVSPMKCAIWVTLAGTSLFPTRVHDPHTKILRNCNLDVFPSTETINSHFWYLWRSCWQLQSYSLAGNLPFVVLVWDQHIKCTKKSISLGTQPITLACNWSEITMELWQGYHFSRLTKFPDFSSIFCHFPSIFVMFYFF